MATSFGVVLEKAKLFEEKFLSPYYCKVCNFDGKSTEDSETHVKSRDHSERVRILASSKTLVLWDMNSCPVPDGCDASLVFPSIQRELEESGFSGGGLTITAIDDLEPIFEQTPDVLRTITSSGILVRNVKGYRKGGGFGFSKQFLDWMSSNPPPATIMLIATAARYYAAKPDFRGYTFVLYPALPKKLCDVNWQPAKPWHRETGESAWCCIHCKDTGGKSLLGESFEEFTKHLHSRGHKLSKLDTLVWWDINSCPVPDGCDASLVFPSIQRELEKSGFTSGDLTITAIGDLEPILKQTPDVLPALSSSGVLLKHLPRGLEPWGELVNWAFDYESCALVLISSRVKTDSGCTRILEDKGHIVLLYPALTEPRSEINWQPAKAWCTETDESAWCCILCRHTRKLFGSGSFHGKSVEDFTKHLESRVHELSELEMSDTPSTPSRDMQLPCFYPDGATSMPKTLVWWDINSCPVPDGYDDASLVVGSINLALEKSGFSGVPLTITAIGNLNPTLNQTPCLLPALASAGVLLKHVPGGFEFMWGKLVRWTLHNRPPANIILLTSPACREHFVSGIRTLEERGYVVESMVLVDLLTLVDATTFEEEEH